MCILGTIVLFMYVSQNKRFNSLLLLVRLIVYLLLNTGSFIILPPALPKPYFLIT